MKKNIIILLLLFLSFSLFGQVGKPFIINYTPSDYNADTQIWSVLQDNNGIMYFGSNEDLLIFDGANWDKVDMGEHADAIRSLGIDDDGTIYIGSVGEFGYLETNKKGTFKYISLSSSLDSIDKDFTDIWTLRVSGNNVYFCSNEALFRYNKEAKTPLKRLDTTKTYFLAYKVRDKIFVTTYEEGLKEIVGDSLISIPMGEKMYPWTMLPYDNDKYLLNLDNNLIVYDPKAKNKKDILTEKYFNQKALIKTNAFLKSQHSYITATAIGNDLYALSTIQNGFIIINKEGEIINNINKQAGLGGQTVQYLLLDNEQQLWTGTSYGISHIEINSAFEYFDERDGAEGSFYHVFRFNNILYASSNLGIFFWKNNKFQPIPELTKENSLQVFAPQEFIYDRNKKLYTVTTIYGIFKLERFNASLISKSSPISIYQSRYDSNIVYFTEDYDLYSAKLGDELKNPKKLFTYNKLLYVHTEKDINNLWLIVNSKPILYNLQTKEVRVFDNNSEIKNIKFFDCKYINNKNLFFTNNGLYIYNLGKFSPFNNFLDNITYGKNIQQIEKISDKEYWLNYSTNNKNKLAILRQENGKFIFDSLVFKKIKELDLFYNDNDSIMWIVSSKKIFKFNPKIQTDYSIKNDIIIRKIINQDSILFNGLEFKNWKNNTKKIGLKYKNNDLKFYFSLPAYSNPEDIEYSYILDGEKKQKWSKWSSQNFKEFTNLHEGKYIFKVKARNIYNNESNIVEFNFTIYPPWHRSILAYIFYLIFFLLIIWLAIKVNSIRMKRENERLDNLVKIRTTEINQQNEEIKTQADNLTEINKLLTEKNNEVNQQNEEIKAIANSLERANKEIIQQNNHITSSITYAERIQKAMLPSNKILKNSFKEHFILYIPKDIISGDFYWTKHLKNHILIAVADCTGHGVPGGFISMLGISVLNEVVRDKNIQTSKDVLETMRKHIKSALFQEDKRQYDGLDIAFIDINTDTDILTYSGAYSQIYIIRNDELRVYKPVLNPIGYYPFEKPFKNTEIQLQKDDMIYLFSDGYKDQLNYKNRTMNSKLFKEILMNNNKESATVQKQNLLDNFLEWKGNKKQTDDILILGLRW